MSCRYCSYYFPLDTVLPGILHTGGDALHGYLQDVVNRSSVIVVLERGALQKCDSQLFHAELIAVFFVLKRASRDEVSHLSLIHI